MRKIRKGKRERLFCSSVVRRVVLGLKFCMQYIVTFHAENNKLKLNNNNEKEYSFVVFLCGVWFIGK
jgi:hypothetical protein